MYRPEWTPVEAADLPAATETDAFVATLFGSPSVKTAPLECVWSTDDSAMFAFNDVKRRKATWNLVDSRTCSGSYSPYKTCNVTLENGCVIRGTYVFTAAGTMSPIYQTILLSAKELLVATCKSGKCCCCCCC
jgi:hypothetical protein